MSSFGTTGLTKRTAKGSCLRRTSSPVLHPPGGGASASSACYPTCLPAFTSRLLFRVVRNVQPAQRINFGVPLPLYRASNRRVRAWRLHFRYDLDEQCLEMRVLGQLVLFGGINVVVPGQEITRLAAAMRQIYRTAADHQAVGGSGVLALGPFDKATAALVLHAVVHEQKSLGRW